MPISIQNNPNNKSVSFRGAIKSLHPKKTSDYFNPDIRSLIGDACKEELSTDTFTSFLINDDPDVEKEIAKDLSNRGFKIIYNAKPDMTNEEFKDFATYAQAHQYDTLSGKHKLLG